MWLIVGLGNPGRAYSKTRHNLGFMVIDALSLKFSIPLENELKNFIYGRGYIKDKDVILTKPLTFMNRSGFAVKAILGKHMNIDNILVIHDDIDLNTGVLKVKKNGSAGGHKGIESVIDILGTKDFLRIKLGIGRPERVSAEGYVLSPFSEDEKPLIGEVIEKAVNTIAVILDKGVSYAQNKFH